MDDAELSAWEARQLGGAKALELPWQALTHQNADVLWQAH